MSARPAGSCRSCGAAVRWVEMADGRRHQLDPEPAANGRIVIEASGKGRKLERGEQPSGPAYVSHFSTCPQARDWRPGGEQRRAAPRPGSAAGQRTPAPRPPTRAPSAAEFVDAIRSTVWHIKAGAEPQQTATAMLHAATQVLMEGGRTVEQVQELVARGVR